MPPKPRSPHPGAHTSNRGLHTTTPLGECGMQPGDRMNYRMVFRPAYIGGNYFSILQLSINCSDTLHNITNKKEMGWRTGPEAFMIFQFNK